MPLDLSNIRSVILEVINDHAKQGPGYFQQGPMFRAIREKITGKGTTEEQQVILTIWHDLFRTGILAPGLDFSNPDLPFLHLTQHGRKVLENQSRDPSNSDGYLAHLRSKKFTDAIAISYIEEALLAYNTGCYKSVAVMVGCATERLVLMVRDELDNGFTRRSKSAPKGLSDWRYKTMRDAISTELDANRQQMTPQRLQESYSAFWVPLTEQPRLYRNDAGHPQSITPVTVDTVHSNLLIFPELAQLVSELLAWIRKHYV